MNITAALERSCEVCGNKNLIPVLDLGLHPMCDDLVKVGEERICKEYPIDIVFCRNCRTAHQRYQIPKQDLFPRTYHYRSRFTADVLRGMSSLVDSCETQFGSLAGKRVLDVGCNDGSLLTFFRNKGATTLGVEPTDAYLDAQRNGHTVYNNFLSEEVAAEVRAAHGAPDFIVFTNVFAHIENLPEVLRSIRLLKDDRTVVVIENHYLGSVLDGNQFDTFYHEHPRTYSYTSFVHIARTLQMPLAGAEFPARYGGNIRVFIGGTGNRGQDQAVRSGLENRESQFLEQFASLRANVAKWRRRKRRIIEQLVSEHGPLRAKAFPGRAAILVQLLGLDSNLIVAVHEKPGSMKIDHYVPGTRLPIVSDDMLFALADNSTPILNLAWHISKEIRSYLAQHGYTGPVTDIISSDDFGSD